MGILQVVMFLTTTAHFFVFPDQKVAKARVVSFLDLYQEEILAVSVDEELSCDREISLSILGLDTVHCELVPFRTDWCCA